MNQFDHLSSYSLAILLLSILTIHTVIAVQHELVVHRTCIQHITVQVEYIVNVINMPATKVPSPYRKYDDSMWIIYINEAIQSGNHKRYCEQHNIIYQTF